MESKNIHVLQTDNPSRLLRKGKELLLVEMPKVYTFFGNTVSVNIYVTNDEEPKLDQWGINLKNNVVFKCKGFSSTEYTQEYHKKIILTTDLDLIKDGVQSIDDDFLEWFVKNPSETLVKLNAFYEGVKCQERSYNEKELKQAWEDGRDGTVLVGIPPFTITKFKHSIFVKWFDEFKNK
jgi:hypothetical protein